MNVEFFNRDTFNELNRLENLSISNIPIKWINKEVLWPMKDSLINLTINHLNKINLYNLTGCLQLTALNILYIQNSRIHSIKNNSLQGLINTATIILNNCSIQTIEIESFRSVTNSLVYIDLRANYLTVICENLFIGFLSTPGMIILIDNNPWNCSILSNNLVDIVNNNSNIFYTYLCLPSTITTTTETTTISTFISSTGLEESETEITSKTPNSCNKNILLYSNSISMLLKINLFILLLQLH